jgi:bla regulator protein blaR1
MFTAIILAAVLYTPSDGYILINGSGTSVEDGSFNVQEVDAIRRIFGPDVFWFRASGKSYIVRDAAAIKKIDSLFEPERELSGQQVTIGAKQAELGRKQAELGARQARAGGDVKLQVELSRRQDELAKQQDALARQQADLGSKQEMISREVREKLSSLTKSWIRTGVAKPLVTQEL